MPCIGLLSDSHGRGDVAHLAVKLLVKHGAQVLVHLGDVGSTHCLDALVHARPGENQPVQAHVVFGNSDVYDLKSLRAYALYLGLQVAHPLGSLSLEQGALAFLHGDMALLMNDALKRQPRYLCHGHTHQRRDEMVGPTRVICPGALYRARSRTVALLDTQQDRLQFYPLEEEC